ncbi:MAG: hypothetical protein ACI90V_008914, partial [Bacillariaceae sp.]
DHCFFWAVMFVHCYLFLSALSLSEKRYKGITVKSTVIRNHQAFRIYIVDNNNNFPSKLQSDVVVGPVGASK